MGEFQQVRRAMGRRAPSRTRRVARENVVDLGEWKRRRKAQEVGKHGLLRQVQAPTDTRGPA